LLGFGSYDRVVTYHRGWVDEKWTRSIAVGSKGFVKVKSILGALVLGRKSIEAEESDQLREPAVAYSVHCGVKNNNTGL